MKFKAKIIISLIILAIVIIVLVFVSVSRKSDEHTFFTVERGTVSQEISETGTVKKGDKISLSFKGAGQLEEIYVESGDTVTKGTLLAKLDNAQLYMQLEQTEADLALAQAELDKLLAGATEEEVQVAQTSVDKAESTLEGEQKDLENAEDAAQQALDETYQDAFNTLNDAYLKAYNAFTDVSSIQSTYFTDNDHDSLSVKENKDKIEDALDEMEFYLDKVKLDFTEQNIDFALTDFKVNLANVRDSLSNIRSIIQKIAYRSVVSSSDKTSLDTHRSNINTVYSNTITDEQALVSIKITNQTNLDTATANVISAKDSLTAAQDNLALITAEPREEDVALYQAKVKSAQARVDILESQIQDTILRSPTNGTITALDKFVGETVQATMPIISILPSARLEIEVNIYEEDIVRIKEGNLARISLVAFPGEIFTGKVIFVEPAEKLIDGIVYYTVRANFESVPEGVKPGMTADVSIITALKNDVLKIPEEAIMTKGDYVFVKILKDKGTEEREIEIGLEGVDDMVEVLAGLEEGEEIIIE
jgi:multidrug efflux pump subunit AcrA (membrane-fusion protein)